MEDAAVNTRNNVKKNCYIMESSREAFRLEIKTDIGELKEQVFWAGLKPGMRVADIGCGIGKTTSILKSLTGPGGEVTGIDRSEQRLEYARRHYGGKGIHYVEKDIFSSPDLTGKFDFVWVRFFLEYHRTRQYELVRQLREMLAPGGILCLADLDLNCVIHHGWSGRLKRAVEANIKILEEDFDFDPYAGRRLYSHLYSLELKNIRVKIDTHNLIYGKIKPVDEINWLAKVDVACRSSGYDYPEYPGGFDEFFRECRDYFTDPGRFTYTPLVICRGNL